MAVVVGDGILRDVEKPSRYTGNEWNSVHKDPMSVSIRFAFCFPDVYEVGMSHLGMRILYHLLNEREDTYCERVFAPWTDMEEKMRQEGIPLFALESRDALSDFDFIGFTLQYEMSYTNIINMLDLSSVPIYAVDRKNGDPFVCAGGPCAYNPEPLAVITDFFVLGEGEEIINELMDVYIAWKQEGAPRKEFLDRISHMEGIYVPKFYEPRYNPDGTISSLEPGSDRFPRKIKKRIIRDLDKAYFPEKCIVPYMDIVHDRIMLELFRGCIRGCRFCQAGFIYRPVRERTPDNLTSLAGRLVNSTGYEEISLSSLSTSDYTGLERLTQDLSGEMTDKRVSLSLPSLRIDSFTLDLLKKTSNVRKSGLTFAPEAGSQRLRDIINKGVDEEDLLNSVSIVFNEGVSRIKLYFMIGLPSETYEDLEGIADLAEKVVRAYMDTDRIKRGKGLKVTISAASFVPKPFTPFQWEAQDTVDVLTEKQKFLGNLLRGRYIEFNWHDPQLSFLEAVIARGDRRLGEVLVRAWEKGCRFDGWSEHFKFDKWLEAFKECGIDPHFYANRKRGRDEIFPWEHIDAGISREFLQRENNRAYAGKLTPNCRTACSNCGSGVFTCEDQGVSGCQT